MMDRLEEFIKQNRSSFDDLKAPADMWHKVRPYKLRLVHASWKWIAVAASVLFLITAAFMAGSYQGRKDGMAWKEFETTEQYYTQRVSAKMEQIRLLGVGEEVMSDIQVLDEVYHQLRKEMLDDPNADPQLLLEVMIRHQQQKLEVMEKIVHRVDKYKTPADEDVEI